VAGDQVRIDRVVIRVPADALPVGQGDGPARTYGREVVDALAAELWQRRAASAGAVRLRIDAQEPTAVARRIAAALTRPER
jgi:hypothetical protein